MDEEQVQYQQQDQHGQNPPGGIFGDDDEDDDHIQQQHQHEQYQDDMAVDDILGLDGDDDGEDTSGDNARSLLMKFCPHDSSMLYPKVSSKLLRIFAKNA